VATKRAAAHDRWYGDLEALTDPLTKRNQVKIRAALPRQQAMQLIKDWPRIGEIVLKYAIDRHRAGTLPSEKKSLDKEKKAAAAALKALTSIDKQLDAFHKHWVPIWKTWYRPRLDNHDPSDGFVDLVRGFTNAQREKITGFGNVRPRLAKRGRPRTPGSYLLDVLVAYFNHHKWKVTIHSHNFAAGPAGNPFAKESPFMKTAFAVLGRDSLSVATRKRLARQDVKSASSVYPSLDEITPSLTPKRKRELLARWRR
jgi:hypothetical protein